MNALITHPDFAAPDRRTVFLPKLKSRFLEHLSEYGNVRLACQRAGVSRQTAYRERRRAPGFAALWDAAMLAARWHAEEALAERAINGVEEAVFYHGEEVAKRRRYDSRLLLAHLGRLDKVAERADAGAALAGLDDAIEGLAKGEEVEAEFAEAVRAADAQASPDGEAPEKQPQDSVPYVPLEWDIDPDEEPCDDCGGRCKGPLYKLTENDCMWFDHRVARMNDAVPEGEERARRSPEDAAREEKSLDEIHVDAYECGLAKWWLIASNAELLERLGW